MNRSAGVSTAHSSCAIGQRGWKAQPDGGLSIDGGDPGIGLSRSLDPSASSFGSDSSSPLV